MFFTGNQASEYQKGQSGFILKSQIFPVVFTIVEDILIVLGLIVFEVVNSIDNATLNALFSKLWISRPRAPTQ